MSSAAETSGGISTRRDAVCAIAVMALDMFTEGLAANAVDRGSFRERLGTSKTRQERNSLRKECRMIAEFLIGAALLSCFSGKKKTREKHGKTIFGCRYRDVSGECYSCNGSGKVHGKTCRKCGGSGKYSHRTWRPKKGEIYLTTDGIKVGRLF